ncbi:MAG: hypothetical protein ABW321_29555 [Polyangiales bacterium]
MRTASIIAILCLTLPCCGDDVDELQDAARDIDWGGRGGAGGSGGKIAADGGSGASSETDAGVS